MKVKKINWLLMVIHLVVGFGISAVLVLVGGSSLPYEMADLMVGMAVFGVILSALSLLILGALFYAVGKKRNPFGGGQRWKGDNGRDKPGELPILPGWDEI